MVNSTENITMKVCQVIIVVIFTLIRNSNFSANALWFSITYSDLGKFFCLRYCYSSNSLEPFQLLNCYYYHYHQDYEKQIHSFKYYCGSSGCQLNLLIAFLRFTHLDAMNIETTTLAVVPWALLVKLSFLSEEWFEIYLRFQCQHYWR